VSGYCYFKLSATWGKKLVKIKISMTIDKDVFENFKNFCKQNGMKISTKVELLMRESVKDTTLNRFIK
jgi:uncharacterized protein (DUF4415 family)